MLAPARLSEAEGIRAYEFYAATDAAVYTARDEGDAYVTDPVTTAWGVAAGAPWTAVEAGLVVYGSDRRLHYLRGREAQAIDSGVTDLWDDVLALAYDPRPSTETLAGPDVGPLLWALVEDKSTAPGAHASFGGTGKSLHAFSFGDPTSDPPRPAGWVAHRAVDADAETVFYDDPDLSGQGLCVLTPDTGEVYDVEKVDGSGGALSPLWASGVLSDTQRVQLFSVAADVNSGRFDPGETVTIRGAVRHPSVVQVGQTAGMVVREGTVSTGRPVYPRLPGLAAQVSVAGFDVLRSVGVDLRPA
jgi:hypothetical protein